MPSPSPIFGTAIVGEWYVTPESVEHLLENLQDVGISHLDTAARYPPTNIGESERLLGAAGVGYRQFRVDTKVLLGHEAKGSLSAPAIAASVENSLRTLRIAKIGTLYCHGPDPQTPLEETAGALDAQYRLGRFEQLGISNFTMEMMAEYIEICSSKGYVKPTVYQGQYNLLRREDEKRLLPFLREHGIVYNAFSPLAGGFLTGKLTSGDVANTRLAPGNPLGDFMRRLYDKPDIHSVISGLQTSLKEHQLAMPELALRWLFFHSSLGEGDGVIMGASKPAQIRENMAQIQNGPLPQSVVKLAEDAMERFATALNSE